ncbi:MAG: hypothetical protein AB1345_09680 [Chloroflexota bacterium]
MAVYKVSYVITGKNHPGAIVNRDTRPEVGDKITLGEEDFVVVEVVDLMPPRGDFHFIHATCRPLEKDEK